MTLLPDKIIDRTTRVTPLGVRFYDFATNRRVGDLIVTAHADAHPSRKFTLQANPSGVFVLQNLPGLRDFEFGEGDQAFWERPPAQRPYTLTVSDPQRRFLSFTFQADVPTHRLLQWACNGPGSPPEITDVPLFSMPSRSVPEGMTVVLADLHVPGGTEGDPPAAWAVIDVHYEGRLLGRGISDQRGCAAAIVPYPRPVDFLPLSPATTGVSVQDQQWTLDISIAYAPVVESPPAAGNTISPILDLCGALSQMERPLAAAWSDSARTVRLTQDTLYFGQNLILRTRDSGTGRPLSKLLITPEA